MLEPIGVRPEDEEVYRELLSRPEASPRELAAALERDVVAVGRSLTRLEELGGVDRRAGVGALHHQSRDAPSEPGSALRAVAPLSPIGASPTRSPPPTETTASRAPAPRRTPVE